MQILCLNIQDSLCAIQTARTRMITAIGRVRAELMQKQTLDVNRYHFKKEALLKKKLLSLLNFVSHDRPKMRNMQLK